MSNGKQNKHDPTGSDDTGLELQGHLLQAVDAVCVSPIEPALIERCRQAALAVGQHKNIPTRSTKSWPDAFSIALACLLFFMLHLFQAWLRMPASDRELAAVYTTTSGEVFEIYTDLRSERISSIEPANNGSKK